MKYTFLSKWTVLILTVVTAALTILGLGLLGVTFGGYLTLSGNSGLGILSLLVAFLIYALAWVIGFLDSLQERRFGWSVALVLLLPVLIGPVLYSLIGPRNTR